MKNIKKLYLKDIILINEFIREEKEYFNSFASLGWTDQNIKNQFEKENNYSLGYFKENKLCAFLIGETLLIDNKLELEIHLIFVSNKERRKNIGTHILDYIEENKHINKISIIYLEVSEKNLEANRFYEKNNFVFFKFRHNYYKQNNEFIDAKCYSKKLIYE